MKFSERERELRENLAEKERRLEEKLKQCETNLMQKKEARQERKKIRLEEA